MGTSLLRQASRGVVEAQGWRSGTDLEDRVANRLYRWGHGPDVVSQQHGVGPYRLDFAWPALKIGLEVDGWYHRSPEGAAKDAERDSWLRSQGWLIFRVDDRHGEDCMAESLARVCRTIRQIQSYE